MNNHPLPSFPYRAGRHALRSAISVLFFFTLNITISAATDLSQPPLRLTAAEQAWLDAHPNIRLAVDIDWAPFEYIDESQEYKGMAADYIRLVEERLGIRFAVDKERPWAQMVEGVKKGELDVFSLVVKTPQRESFVHFTNPYISFPMVIVTLENNTYVDSIEALRDRTVAVVESYASHDLLAKNHPKLSLHLSKNVQDGLAAVSHGKAFAFIGNLAVISETIRKTGITNIKVSGQTPYRFELSMAVRKDWPELIPILQKGLDSITPKERDEIYHR
ncbi:MAG: hypothetical protein D3910_03250 [Candidatus Electrothrix sp. ATG2]|nr:hypothetical protein [Candidatus Electrothrix sp. ATG2]